MKPGDDLAAEALGPILGTRPLRSDPVLLSIASSAREWAAAGAADGAVVVADYQIAPRGRAGLPWKTTAGRGLGFAVVLRPQLPSAREGWIYTVILAALADVCGEGVTIEWPDEIRRQGEMVAGVSVEVRLGGRNVEWVVANLLIPAAEPPRGPLLAAVLKAIEERLASPPADVLEDYRRNCATIGRSVRVKLLGGSSKLEGLAAEPLDDGALVLETSGGRRVPVRPQDISSIQAA